MDKVIVGLFGLKRAGKDSLANQLVDNFGYKKWHFADNLRRVMEAFNPIIDTESTGGVIRLNEILDRVGWEEAKTNYPEVRKIMKELGTNGVRHILGNQTWIQAIDRQLEDDTGGLHVIADGRFLNESEYVRSKGGLIVKVHRRWATPQAVDDHESESEIDLIEADINVMNEEGLEGLRQYAQAIHAAVRGR